MPLQDRDKLIAQIKLLIPTLGVRGAARKLGVNEDTACWWAHIYKWTDDPDIKAALALVPRPHLAPKTPDAPDIENAKAVAQAMKGDAIGGRRAGLRATRTALEFMAEQDGPTLCIPEVADVLHKHIKSASVAGGYGASDSVARIALTVTGAHSTQEEQVEHPWADAIEVEPQPCEPPSQPCDS